MLKTNRVRRLASQVAASIAILSLSCPIALGAGAGWYTNYDDAVKAARREGKPIFADFSTEWCPSCRLLEKNTLTDPGIVQRLDGFVKVHIDAEKQKTIADRYQVKAYPTVVTMDPSGNMVNSAVGYMKPRELASTLDSSMMTVGQSLQQQRTDVAAKKAEKDAKDKELADAKAKEAADTKAKAKKAEVAADEPAAKTVRAVAEAQAEARRMAKGGGNQMLMSQGGERKLPASSAIEPVSEELPRPFLNRAGGEVPAISQPVLETSAKAKATEPVAKKSDESAKKSDETKSPALAKAEAPAAAATKKTESAPPDPMATVRLLQAAAKSDNDKPAAGSDAVALVANDSKVVAMAAPPKASVQSAAKPDSATETVDATKVAAASPTREDLEGYFRDANEKLVAGKKKEARALYEHVVDKDPENQHGISDLAFVRMVSLIVDKDDDLLRRKAYNRIREFEARFPESKHKDYYTLIRATLAADLNETNAAHVLLDNFTERFPDSKFKKKAYETWKTLPPVKKESTATKVSDAEKQSRT